MVDGFDRVEPQMIRAIETGVLGRMKLTFLEAVVDRGCKQWRRPCRLVTSWQPPTWWRPVGLTLTPGSQARPRARDQLPDGPWLRTGRWAREAVHGALPLLNRGRERSSVTDATCALEQRSNAHICPTFGNEQNLVTDAHSRPQDPPLLCRPVDRGPPQPLRVAWHLDTRGDIDLSAHYLRPTGTIVDNLRLDRRVITVRRARSVPMRLS